MNSMIGSTNKQENNKDVNKQVHLTIDGKQVVVSDKLNLIEAAKRVEIDIPHFCYHPCLSKVGSCRMCQVEIEGETRLQLACLTKVREGLVVNTSLTSKRVQNAQKAILQFLLLNHPLDCTICDQCGRCKLQDLYFKYSQEKDGANFIKTHSNKAVKFGEEIIYDAERCIKCTRCVRFCREVTQSAELGLENRGDRLQINFNEQASKILYNPFFSCVADICPVGALTQRMWRFKSRPWLDSVKNTICSRCAKACKCRVNLRDGEVVYVAGEDDWLCDVGRKSFSCFFERLVKPMLNGAELKSTEAIDKLFEVGDEKVLVFFSSNLLIEDLFIWKEFLELTTESYTSCVLKPKKYCIGNLSRVDAVPAFDFFDLNQIDFSEALKCLITDKFKYVIFVGDEALKEAISLEETQLKASLLKLNFSIAMLCSKELSNYVNLSFPSRFIFERSGMLLNVKEQLLNYKPLFEKESLGFDRFFLVSALRKLCRNEYNLSCDDELTSYVLQHVTNLAEKQVI